MSGFALERIPERKWRGVRPSLADGRFKAEIQCERCGALDTWRCVKVPERAKLQASTLLESEFDVEKGRYKDGSSDKAVADAVGLSEQAVADLRGLLGLVIVERPEIAALRKDLEAAVTRALALDADMRRFGKLIDAEVQRVEELRQRLEVLAK